jgi:guanylate kinase
MVNMTEKSRNYSKEELERTCSEIISRAEELYPDSFPAWKQSTLTSLFLDREVINTESLSLVSSEFRDFVDIGLHPRIRVRKDLALPKVGEQGGMVAYMGPSGAGKDTILDQIMNGTFCWVQTATTRPFSERDKARGRDIKESRYEFLTEGEFTARHNKGELIEIKPQGGYLYGTPKSSLLRAFDCPEPIKVWRGELVGMQKLKRWMADEYPRAPFVKVFVIPEMPLIDYCIRMENIRDDAQTWRFPTALWEFEQSASLVDIYIHNPPDASGIPREAAEATQILFNSLVG